MHRREIEMLAATIRARLEPLQGNHHAAPSDFDQGQRYALESIARDMCQQLSDDNPQFRSKLFMQACGVRTPRQ